MLVCGVALGAITCLVQQAWAASWPAATDGTYVEPEFRFADGETMRNLRLHYVTLGTIHRDAAGHVDNAVLILHGTGGDTTQFLRDEFAGVMFVPGGLLDASKYFIVITDGIGHGKSSKPSDGLREKFPHYGYRDMIRAQHDVLVDALHVDHLMLVMGTSMGGMQTWLWGETYPSMMDLLMPLASLPIQISGRDRVWRDMMVDDVRNDPDYRGGEYKSEPIHGIRAAWYVEWIFSSAPLYDQTLMPNEAAADASFNDKVKPLAMSFDANDMIYQLEASRDYDPEPDLGKITAALLAVNSADDQINPPELGIIDKEIEKVRHGRFVLLPITPTTRGHGTHTLAAVWENELHELLNTYVNVPLHRLSDGRRVDFGRDDGTTIELPTNWSADAGLRGIHDVVYLLRPDIGPGQLELVLSTAFYQRPLTLPDGKPYCRNGLHGQTTVEDGRRTIMLVFPHDRNRITLPADRGPLHQVYMTFRADDAAAERIAHSFRFPAVATKC